MPSSLPLPTIDDYLSAARKAQTGERDRYANARVGGILDHASGPTAILFAREADRDQDIFRSIYFDDAQGDQLTDYVADHFGIARFLDTYGAGTCTFARSSSAAGAGPFLQGTRIFLAGSPPKEYQVAADTLVGSTTATVPIRSTTPGSGTAAVATSGLSLEDAVYDPLWKPTALACAAGTDFEEADDFRARVRKLRKDQRTGYVPELVLVCQAQGAAYAIAFPSSYGLQSFDLTNDYGINAIYVADANFQSSTALVGACAIATESARVLGADLWVGGIVQQAVTVNATVYLNDDPGRLDTTPIRRAVVQALLGYFAPTQAGYLYKRSAMSGACCDAHPAVQQVVFTTPSSDPSLNPSAWPANLTRYTLAPQNIVLTFAPPL